MQSLQKSWMRSAADSCIYISLCYNCPSPQPNRNPKTEQRIETNLNISDFESLIFFYLYRWSLWWPGNQEHARPSLWLPQLSLEKFWAGQKAYGTRCSQAVPHPSTILARWCLTSVIRRERVCSSWYGRRWQWYKMWSWNLQILFLFCRRADWGILQSLGKSWLRCYAESAEELNEVCCRFLHIHFFVL